MLFHLEIRLTDCPRLYDPERSSATFELPVLNATCERDEQINNLMQENISVMTVGSDFRLMDLIQINN